MAVAKAPRRAAVATNYAQVNAIGAARLGDAGTLVSDRRAGYLWSKQVLNNELVRFD